MSISTSTQITNYQLPITDIVGVGDAIIYNASSSIVFISARASSTAYTVQDADGSVPDTAAVAETDWCIFRAYTSLYNAERGDENSGLPDAVENFDDWDEDGDIDDTDEVGRDLVSNNEQWNIACYGDAVDAQEVSVSGWTTGEDNYLKFYTPVSSNEVGESQRHSGKWDEDKYMLYDNHSGYSVLYILDNFLRIEGLQIRTGSNGVGINDSSTMQEGDIRINNNIIQTNSNVGSIGIHERSNKKTIYIWDNIIYENSSLKGSYGIDTSRYTNPNTYIYNNTIIGYEIGLYRQSQNVTAKNNIVQNCTDGYNGTFVAYSDNNISDVPGDQPASGAHDQTGVNVQFVDEINDDFHISPDDTAAIDQGTSSVSISFNQFPGVSSDIDGKPIHTYDIGADDASVYFEPTVKQSGGDFSTLSSWEAGVDCDLTATATLTFSATSSTGVFQPYETSGRLFTGQTSGATGQLIHLSTTTSDTLDQVLLVNISGIFVSGEDVRDGYGTTTLLNAGNYPIAVAKIDGAWSVADETAVTIDDWTTGEYNYIKIYTTEEARHNGVWDEEKYRLDGATTHGMLKIYEDFIRINGLQVANSQPLANTPKGIVTYGTDGNNGELDISYNIIRYGGPDIPGWGENGIDIGKGYFNKTIFSNNIIYNWGFGIFYSNSANIHINKAIIYNNTVYSNSSHGISFHYSSGGDIRYIKNNIAINNGTDFYLSGGWTSVNNNNISSDSTAPGDNSKINTTVQFLDSTNNDFRLATEDTAARDAGVDLSEDANLHFTDDAAGNERYDAKWDIGALEGPTIIYRSVGNDTSNLAGAGNTVDITKVSGGNATTTAIFASALPDNVGVGDVLQYGGSGYYTLAFITSRASSTQYEVQARDGALPTATTSAPVKVFRAHEYLDYWEDQVENEVNAGIDSTVDELVLYPKTSLDLTASNTAMFVSCYASTSADTRAVEINGWTTATTSYIKVYTPVNSSEVGETQRHSGVWDNNKYSLSISSGPALVISENYIRAQGLQIYCADSYAVKNENNGFGAMYYTYNIIQGNSADNIPALSVHAGNGTTTIYNNIIYGSTGAGAAGLFASSGQMVIYNNTVYNNTNGIEANAAIGGIKLINNAVFGNTDDFSGDFTILDHNASDDGDGTNPVSLGSSTIIWNGAFVDYVNYDFRIRNVGSVLYDAGTTITTIADDILGNTRPWGDAYDIGAFEYVGFPLVPKYRFNEGGYYKLKGHIEFK